MRECTGTGSFVKKLALKDWQHCCTREDIFFRRISSCSNECKCLERLVVRNVNVVVVGKKDEIQMGGKEGGFISKE